MRAELVLAAFVVAIVTLLVQGGTLALLRTGDRVRIDLNRGTADVLIDDAEIADLAVHPRGERRLGEARPDGRGDVGRGRALRHLPHGAVGKRDSEHLGHAPALSG